MSNWNSSGQASVTLNSPGGWGYARPIPIPEIRIARIGIFGYPQVIHRLWKPVDKSVVPVDNSADLWITRPILWITCG